MERPLVKYPRKCAGLIVDTGRRMAMGSRGYFLCCIAGLLQPLKTVDSEELMMVGGSVNTIGPFQGPNLS